MWECGNVGSFFPLRKPVISLYLCQSTGMPLFDFNLWSCGPCAKMRDTLISVTFDGEMLMKLGKLGMLRQRQSYILAHKWVMIGDGFLQPVPPFASLFILLNTNHSTYRPMKPEYVDLKVVQF